MANDPFENIDFDENDEERINGSVKNKPESIKDVMFVRGNVVIESTNLDICFIAVAFQDACKKYGIDFEECAILFYIYELGLVPLTLKMPGKEFWLGTYLQKGFLEEDWSHKHKKLHKLSNYGLEIINYISKALSNKQKYIGLNRVSDIDVETRMKSVLGSYFS